MPQPPATSQKYKKLSDNSNNAQSGDEVLKIYNQVNLLKWLFPDIQNADYKNKLAQIK